LLEHYSSTSEACALTRKQWPREHGLAGVREMRQHQQQ